jgi:methylmalonyl-CoA mutase N-terminal domain/subunit
MDPAGYQRQVDRLHELKSTRDSAQVGQALDQLRLACQGTLNTMPYILNAVRAYATLGEIVEVMKEVFGTYTESNWI